jgi:hypothetical protein
MRCWGAPHFLNVRAAAAARLVDHERWQRARYGSRSGGAPRVPGRWRWLFDLQEQTLVAARTCQERPARIFWTHSTNVQTIRQQPESRAVSRQCNLPQLRSVFQEWQLFVSAWRYLAHTACNGGDPMNEDQNLDHANQEETLTRLLSRRHNLPPDSEQMPALKLEINAVENLVRSYRLVQAIKPLETAKRCFVQVGSDPPLCGLHHVRIVEREFSGEQLPAGFGNIKACVCPVSDVVVPDVIVRRA